MTEALKGKFYTTGVGSLPYSDPKAACEKILSNFMDIPFWPQLTRRSFFESMYCQFSEKIPGATVDENAKKIFIDTEKDYSAEQERLYEAFLGDDVDFFSISSGRAAGLYAFLEALKSSGKRPAFVKGQIIGPVSFGLTVTDSAKRPVFYDPQLRDTAIKALSMRARWQIRRLKQSGAGCILFIDEPYLASIGSSYVNLKKQEAAAALDELIKAVHKEGAACGLHCCGNTDWGFLLGLDIDILNFDAYNFSDSLALYHQELSKFLKRGGIIAWGIVPTGQDVFLETVDSLIEKFNKAAALLEKKGIDRTAILDSLMVTPSCGLGLMEDPVIDVILKRLSEVSSRLRADK